LPSASFRFHLTMDTLAFGYEIPVITALSGLAPVGNSVCPAHPILWCAAPRKAGLKHK